jgi:hypothetical protein
MACVLNKKRVNHLISPAHTLPASYLHLSPTSLTSKPMSTPRQREATSISLYNFPRCDYKDKSPFLNNLFLTSKKVRMTSSRHTTGVILLYNDLHKRSARRERRCWILFDITGRLEIINRNLGIDYIPPTLKTQAPNRTSVLNPLLGDAIQFRGSLFNQVSKLKLACGLRSSVATLPAARYSSNRLPLLIATC